MWFLNTMNAWYIRTSNRHFEWCVNPVHVFSASMVFFLSFYTLLYALCSNGVMSDTKCDLFDRYRLAEHTRTQAHIVYIVALFSLSLHCAFAFQCWRWWWCCYFFLHHSFCCASISLLFAAVNLFLIQSHECLHWNSIHFTSHASARVCVSVLDR